MSYMIKISSTYLVYSAMFFVSSSCFMCILPEAVLKQFVSPDDEHCVL